MGPFELTVDAARFDLLLSKSSSSSPLTLSGHIDAAVSFPLFLASSLTLSAALTFPKGNRDPPLTLAIRAQRNGVTFLDGHFTFFGRFHPKNAGMVYLTVPGLTVSRDT